MKVSALILMGLAAMAGLGCNTGPKTETGYVARSLDDDGSVQRSYYAEPFSVDAQSAKDAQKQNEEMRRPNLETP